MIFFLIFTTDISRIRMFSAGMFLALMLFAGLPAGHCGDTVESVVKNSRLTAERWHAAEAVFHSDSRWLGGDGANSVDLGNNRVLWLFGDSFVDVDGIGSRRSSSLVRNTIAVQTGYDPSTASMEFAWKIKSDKPAAFFSKSGETWYWPASGILLGKRLLVFLMEVRLADNALGFEACGWKAVWIANPHEPPDRWNLTWLISPRRQNFVVGVGNPVMENGFLQVFAADGKDRSVYLVRWPADAARSGTLTAPQWWAGDQSGWIAARLGKERLTPVFVDGQMEFSVTCQSGSRCCRRVQTKNFLNPCLAVSTAAALTGPWTDAACFFTPPEQGPPDLLIYAGKSHPMLRGADLVFSYVINTTSAERLLSDMTIYFPVILKGKIVTR